MKLQDKIKPLYKHLGVSTFFLVLVIIVFLPIFQGQKLEQHDIKMWMGSAKECIDYRAENNGEETMWTNSMFGGMPSYLVSTKYPGNLIKHVQKVFSLGLPNPAYIFFLALLSFYVCLLCFKVKWNWAAVASIAYSFSTFNIISIGAGHNSKILAVALLPLMLGGLKLITDKKYLIGSALFSLAVALEIGANHIQITYYGIFILLAFAINEGVKLLLAKDYKSILTIFGVILAAGIIGVLPHTSRLWTLQEYGKYTIRGESELNVEEGEVKDGLTEEYVFAYSQGVKENINLLTPNFFGNGQSKWSDYNSYPIYLGASIFFLFILAIGILKPKEWVWLFILTLFGIILALGKNMPGFNGLMYDIFPGYNKFRTVNMALAISQFSIALLAGLALNKLFSKEFIFDKKAKMVTSVTFGALAVLFISSFIISPTSKVQNDQIAAQIAAQNPQASQTQISAQLANYLSPMLEERASNMRTAVLRSVLFIALFIGLYLLYKKSTNENKNLVFGFLASVLLFLDVATVNNNFLNSDSYKEDNGAMIHATKADRYIMSKEGEFRVLDVSKNTFNDATASYFHHSIGGYHSAKLMRFQDLVDNHISKNNMKVLQMLNIKYVLQGPNVKPQELPALGNAWFIKKLNPVTSPDEEIAFLANTAFNPSTNAVVDKNKFSFSKNEFDNSGTIKLTQYAPNKMNYEAQTDKAGVAVFSEIYYEKGWTATIDGEPAKIKRVNYILRALEIPAGKHKIEFNFRPQSYYTGEKIALFGSILVIGLSLVALFFWVKTEEGKTV